jgi:hypothetical protein
VIDTRNKLCQVSRTVVWYVFVHSWVLCRARAGKRLASWVVLHRLEEEGVQDGVIGSRSVSLGRVDSLTPRDVYSWWCTHGSSQIEMTRIED